MTAAAERHPKGLPVLFFTEMWERFSFYLMLGILPLYLGDSQKGGMGMSDKEAAVIVGTYIALVYFTPFIGGLIADRLLGCRKTILIGGVLMMLGHLVLAIPNATGLYLGLGLIILGNGAFKPNISTLLGNLYPKGSKLKDAGYNIFYMGINIGAFVCNFVAAFVRNYFDEHPLQITSTWELTGWHAAFSTAAFGMLLGLLTFAAFYKMFAAADQMQHEPGEQQSLTPLIVECLLPAILLSALAGAGVYLLPDVGKMLHLNIPTAAFLAACIPVIIFYLRIWRAVPDAGDRGRTGALLVIFAVVIVFWAVFHLNTTAMTFWTRDNTDRQTNQVVEVVTDPMPEFAENAPPAYYKNAGPTVPRPHPDTFKVVGAEEYKKLEKENKLDVKQGEQVVVTQKMKEEIEKNATAETPRLPEKTHLKLVNAELYQSINGGYVVLFTPLLVAFWAWLRHRGLEPSTPGKLGIGLFLTACGPLVMFAATVVSQDGAVKSSSGWLFGMYAVVTLGELCLSPMGLSLVNKMAPKEIRAFMMGGWFLSTSFGNKLSGIFGEVYTEMDHYYFWPMLAGAAGFFGVVIFALLPWLNRQMADKTHS